MFEEEGIDLTGVIDALHIARAMYPRVTEIIGKQNEAEMRSIPIENLVNASLRGKKLHAFCTSYILGLFGPEVEPELLPYYTAFVNWANENVARPVACATRLYDDSLKFSGEFDMILEMKDGSRALIDLKTTAKTSKTWPLQLAAYDHLCKKNGYNYDQIAILHLKKKAASKKEKEGAPDNSPFSVAVEYHMQDDLTPYWDIFASALKCFDYFNRKEKKDE